MSNNQFPAATANAVFYRSYSRRKEDQTRETWSEVVERASNGIFSLGNYKPEEITLILDQMINMHTMASGRWMWVGGTEFVTKPKNVGAGYNCSSIVLDDKNMFRQLVRMSMEGTGTGAVLEKKYIKKLPLVLNQLNLRVIGQFGMHDGTHLESTMIIEKKLTVEIRVGDSREGWCDAIQAVIDLAMDAERPLGVPIDVRVDVSWVRPKGQKLKGFGGVANPTALPNVFVRLAEVLNECCDRDGRLTSVECCLLIDEAAKAVVAGNIRRSAGMRQGSSDDEAFSVAKDNMWQAGEDGVWRIDPKRDAFRMANHTRVYHEVPSLEEVTEAVRKQFYSGEGAIQYAPEAIARANADILVCEHDRQAFLDAYLHGVDRSYIAKMFALRYQKQIDQRELEHRISRLGLNPCLTGNMRLLTVDGYKRFDELAGTEPMIINASGDVSSSRVWLTGEKETVLIKTTVSDLRLTCTPDHRWMTIDGDEVEAKDLKGKKLMPFIASVDHDPVYVLLGLIQGDGELRRDKTLKGYTILNVGQNDHDMLNVVESSGFAWEWTQESNGDERRIKVFGVNSLLEDLGFSFTPLPERTLPKGFDEFNRTQKAAFLNGLFGANGSVIGKIGRVSLRSSCGNLVTQVQRCLEDDFGIRTYVTTNRRKEVQFSNGVYTCKESYDLNVQSYTARLSFANNIGFALDYRATRLKDVLFRYAPTVTSIVPNGLENVYDFTEPLTHWGVVEGMTCHNCGEIIGTDFMCNLSEIHLNTIDPHNVAAQIKAFRVGGLIASALLHHEFDNERLQYSREIDPIVGVSFTGLFDFFVKAFGLRWLEWWQAGRPEKWGEPATNLKGEFPMMWIAEMNYTRDMQNLEEPLESEFFTWFEAKFLRTWKDAAEVAVADYCNRNGLRVPNRCTTVQPAGSKSLLTGAASGWHPPKSANYIRRITFQKNDPVALAMIDLGYNVVPAQTDKDENGALLDDPFDNRCTEWLVEIPVQTPAGAIEGADEIDMNKFSALAQLNFYMQVQTHYTTHNTSATIEIREEEIEEFSLALYNNMKDGKGYISAALLARFDSPYPRLPFEAISSERFDQLTAEVESRRKTDDFFGALKGYDNPSVQLEGAAQCDSDKCLFSTK